MTKPSHCYNNTLDGDETIRDAGGSCGCNDNKPVSFCGVGPNQVRVEGTTYIVSSFERDTLGNGQLHFMFRFNSSEYLVVRCQPRVYFNSKIPFANNPTGTDRINVQLKTNTYGLQDLYYGEFEIASDGCATFLRTCNTGFNYQFAGVIDVELFLNLRWFL